MDNLRATRTGDRIPAIFYSRNRQTSSDAPPGFLSIRNRGSFPGINRTRHEQDGSPPSAEVSNGRS